MEPTAQSVRKKIEALPPILVDIIKAEGCAMQNLSLINNIWRRFVKFRGPGLIKNKPKEKYRKATLVPRPCRPDMEPAIDSLTTSRSSDALFTWIPVHGTAATLAFECGAARVDDSDAETSGNENSSDEVFIFLITFAVNNLTSFLCKRCMILARLTW